LYIGVDGDALIEKLIKKQWIIGVGIFRNVSLMWIGAKVIRIVGDMVARNPIQ